MAKYIMSDKDEILEAEFLEIKHLLSTVKTSRTSINKVEYPLGFTSPLLKVATISLYDDSLLMEKFPHGVVTENFVLMPYDKVAEIRKECEKFYPQNKVSINNFKPLFNEFMNSFVEMVLNIELTNEEKYQIKKDLNINFGENINQHSYINIQSPEKITNRDLLKIIEGKGYSFESLVKNPVDLTQDVKETLHDHFKYLKHINSLADSVQNINIQEVNSNLSYEEFVELADKANKRQISPVLPLKIVNNKIDKLLKETNNDMEKFIEQGTTELFPYLSKLYGLQFKSSLEYINKKGFLAEDLKGEQDARFQQKPHHELKHDFSKSLVKHLDNTQRELLINVISNLDMHVDSLSKKRSLRSGMN